VIENVFGAATLARYLLILAGILCACGSAARSASAGQDERARPGKVVDASGAAVAGAHVVLRSAQGAILQQVVSGSDGRFQLDDLSLSSSTGWLEVTATGFPVHRLSVDLDAATPKSIEIVLGIASFRSEATVTAQIGMVADVELALPIVSVRDASEFRARPLATIGNALEGAPGVMVQQSTYGQVSPFLRGLTGYHVINLIDGVRFNNTTFRSGPNQYLAYADPSQAQRIEAMLGPASAQFGSDALGGAIQLITPASRFADGTDARLAVGINLSAGSADRSRAGDAGVFFAGRNLSLSGGAVWRDLGDVRGGGGRDSHHVLRRLFGLSDDQIESITGSRQQGTGFTQSGAHAKIAARIGDEQTLTLWYQRSEMDDVRGYKDQWGGLGRLRSDFEPQGLDFFYSRYETFGLGKLDWLSATFSVNAQRDGSIRQGLRTTDPVIADDGRVDAFGYAVQAGTHITSRHTIVGGGEIYDERIDAFRRETDPVTGRVVQKRALYPNGSTYRTTGLFVQDVVDLVRGANGAGLRANLGGRFTRIDTSTYADRNLNDLGQGLGVIDSSRHYQDWTFNAGVTWQLTTSFGVTALVGRGFRAPNLNDLGALGLNDLGYEVPAESVLDAGGFIGVSDGEGVLSSGQPIASLEAERLYNYEVGASYRGSRLYARAHVFNAELKDQIVRRTLLFPIDRVPTTLAGTPVTPIAQTAAQRAEGVVSVSTALDPRAVKAFVNDVQARYRGIDALASYQFSTRWSAEASYSYLSGDDLNPTRPVRRLPPQRGMVAIRYRPGGRVSWVEASAHVSGAQALLSGGDITDERIGAARRRSDIADFFNGGLIAPWVAEGSDGRRGTPDDVFSPTNETLAQIRDRVLPIGATINGVRVADDGTRVPLYVENAGFVSVNLSAGVVITKSLALDLALTNLLDRNYRVHGSGVDAPGAGLFAGLRFTY
jgi:hemoglobin/transferrin/lactoferrin receptor protein